SPSGPETTFVVPAPAGDQENHAWGDAADVDLVRRCLSPDKGARKAAGDILYRRHQRALLRWISRRLRAWPSCGVAAEDVASSVWASLWEDAGRRLRAYDPDEAPFEGYLR